MAGADRDGKEEVQRVTAERCDDGETRGGRRLRGGKLRQIWVFFTSSQSTWKDKLLVALALAYILSPIDLIPDVMPIVGWLDDLGIAGLLAAYVAKRLSQTAPKNQDDGRD